MNEIFGFIIGLALASILTALLPNTSVTSSEWSTARAVCEHNSGVNYVRGEGAIRRLKVVCKNGVEASPKPTPELTND